MADLDTLLSAMLTEAPFAGFSPQGFAAAAEAAGMSLAEARALAPRGALGLAAEAHRRGDAALAGRLAAEPMEHLRYSEKVARAIELRLELAPGREVLRRSVALFAQPQHAPEAARLAWGTADAIWTALGDTSRDGNWYSKRAILTGVWSACLLYWLGDQSTGHTASHGFIERRIGEVMQFEKFKAQMRKLPFLSPVFRLMEGIKAPDSTGLPGRWQP